VVLNRRLYIDGGEFSYKRGNATAYDYCKKPDLGLDVEPGSCLYCF
jgi:hypothetical protein